MAGTLTLDTLKTSSGVLSVQNGVTGIAKAWVNFAGSTGSINGTSFNVSSVTRISTGNYTVNFTTSMPNANYCATFNNANGARLTWFDTFTTTSINCYCYTVGGPYADAATNCLAIFST
jgi:hypothetical protein